MNGRRWTGPEKATLARMVRAGARADDVADVLGRTPAAVKVRAQKLGVVCVNERSADHGQQCRVLDFYAAKPGATQAEAGKVLRRTPEAIGRMCRRLMRRGLLRIIGSRRGGAVYAATPKWTRANDKRLNRGAR